MLNAPPLSLYVHLPWCVRKCPYCDFNSHAAPQLLPQRSYIDALLEDLDHDLLQVDRRSIVSIFFGGGTPSLFDPEQIGRFLDGVHSRMDCAEDIEVTLEANPGTIEHGRFAAYRDAGVTRVSLGAQSFSDAHLRLLGRIHGVDDIGRAVDELVRAGLHNFNIDVMYALPDQSVTEAIRDVESAIALAPTHLSHYQLTLEPGTVFYHRPPPLPDGDLSWEMQQRCHTVLARAGYDHYEVSAFARPTFCCRHNLNYWRFGDYLGLGAGAHGKVTNAFTAEIVRTSRTRQPREYLRLGISERVQESRRISVAELPFEFMLNTLRLLEGFSVEQFEARTGLPFAAISATVSAAEARGLLVSSASSWRPTDLGQRFLNDLQSFFLPTVERSERPAYVHRPAISDAS
jgi:oxygen-independent coproporphyrinogen-3 oxidase